MKIFNHFINGEFRKNRAVHNENKIPIVSAHFTIFLNGNLLKTCNLSLRFYFEDKF